MNSLSPKLAPRLGMTLAIALLAIAPHVGAQERSLILKTLPEDTVIELTGSLAILPDGNIEAHPADTEICPADTGSCDDVQVGNLNFRVNGQTSITIDEGDTLGFTWKSRGAWSCQAGGNLPGWNSDSLVPDSIDAGNTRFVASNNLAAASPYVATLLCSNGPATSNNGVPNSVSITVNEGFVPEPIPEICNTPARLAPAGWTRLSTGSQSCHFTDRWLPNSDCREFDKLWPASFMSTGQISRDIGVRNSNARDYVAVRFTTEGLSPTATGSFNFNSAPNLTNTNKIVSISQCPGDFNRDAIMAETGCYRTSFAQNLNWGGSQACQLEANQTYYLNIIHTEQGSGTPTQEIQPHSLCASGTRCGTLVTP